MVVSAFKTRKDTTQRAESKYINLIEENIEKSKIELAFDLCFDCEFENNTMSSMPQGMFSARKIRENEERMVLARISKGESYSAHQYFSTKLMELTPLKYNSKLMNSIWGLYNRYSPHNIKRTNDDFPQSFRGLQEFPASLSKSAVLKEAAPNVAKVPGKQATNKPKIENIWSNIPISQSH